MKSMDCSIIICTRNRASMLEATLRAFQSVKIPPDWKVEMLVVDNGSTDHTEQVVKSASHSAIGIRYMDEPAPGKSRAQNTALREAKGEALLFTDDDVEPASDWVECMARPILDNECDATTGRILLADSLRRPWFAPMHEMWLAEVLVPLGGIHGLVGASMGIHRRVFEEVGPFDEELGPGASGFGEETLVWMQMKEAGMRVKGVDETHVIHRPDSSRLLRSSWLQAAARYGRTSAYVNHHWEHSVERFPAMQMFLVRCKLALRGLLRKSPSLNGEGCPEWEMSYTTRMEYFRHFIHESRKPRKYERRALRKITHPTSDAG